MIAAAAVLTAAGTGLAFTQDGNRRFNEFLNGFQEATVVVATTATGTFKATINRDETEINYVLTFKELEGDVLQAHIHIGHPQNQGAIVLWLCETGSNPSPVSSTPSCTEDDPSNLRAGKVTGTLTAADIAVATGTIASGIATATPEEFAQLISLIKAGKTYVNVHSSKFQPGEIRSQLDNRDDENGNHGKGHGDH
jgi:hypothetical protein